MRGLQGHPPDASDAVRVHVHLGRDVDVDDRLELVDVQAAGGQIGGHQHAAAALRELHQHLVALALVQVAVQLQGDDALRLQHGHQVAALLLGVAEGQRRHGAEVVQQQPHGVQALVVAHLVEALADGVRRMGFLQLHDVWLAHVSGPERHHAVGVGGREQQGLALAGALAHDLRDVVGKAHVQHAVGLVQHQGVQRLEIQGLALQVIEDAPRGADHDVRAVGEAGDLRAHGGAAAQREHLDGILGARQAADLLRHLLGQLARGAQHQGLHRHAARVQVGQQGQGKGGGLAAAGARLGDQVAPGQGQGQSGGLHRRHLRVAQALKIGQHLRGQRQAGEVEVAWPWCAHRGCVQFSGHGDRIVREGRRWMGLMRRVRRLRRLRRMRPR